MHPWLIERMAEERQADHRAAAARAWRAVGSQASRRREPSIGAGSRAPSVVAAALGAALALALVVAVVLATPTW